nr:reverse transcriptase domain-containing protein [Tanacetum cinerariifolium]
MNTRSSARNLFPPLDNPDLTIQRRSRTDPTLLNDSEMAAEGPGYLPVPDLRTMEELCQPSLNGRGGTFTKRHPEECYDLIENMTAHHNDWDTSAQWSESSTSSTSSSDTEIATLKAEMAEINKNLMRVLQNVYVTGAYQDNSYQPQGNRNILSYRSDNYLGPQVLTKIKTITIQIRTSITQTGIKKTIILKGTTKEGTNSSRELTKEYLKGITTQSGTAYQGPTIPTTSSSLPLVVERETEATKDTVHPTNNGTTEDVQPLIVPTESLILNSKPVVTPIIEPVTSPVSALKPNQRPSTLYPSRLHDQKLHDKSNDQREKFFQIFKDLNFNISFANALILMLKFGPSIKSLLTNKDKLCELARTPLNEHCSAVLLKKFPEKLGDPNKFLIPCDFPRMAECLALADLGLADRSISHPVDVAEDAFVKVGTFHFLTNFVVVDFDADLRVPLILRRSFLKTERALINVFEGELTHRVGKEAITFNLDQTSRYSANYNDMTANQIDVIDMACEEYSQEVLDFSNVIASGNPTPYYYLIVSTISLTLTPFGNSDFLLEEVDAFLALEDDPTSPEVDQSYVDTEGDILLLEAFLNDDPSLPPPNQENYLPQVRKELKICDDKLPVIIVKDLSVEEKTTLITVLKSYKRAITWKLSDIKGIDPEFYTHIILMEEDFEPAVQHQRRVNPKIHDVIKNEVLKLLDAGLIYPISNSPWRVYSDYQKLNEATRKDHFLLSFMDQMLERLAGNQYYCFLDGFFGYFQIPIDLKDQEKTTFTCPYGTFTYRCMPFGLCNAPGTFQRYMMAIFHDMIKKTMEVFMDDFSVFRNSFQTCLSHLENMLKRCEDTNLCLNWEKSHFMVKEGIVLGLKISKNEIEVDKSKVDVIAKLPHPTTVKGIHSFLGHAGFYRRIIQDFSKIARPMTRLLKKDTPFLFSKECVEAFQTLKRKLTEAPILIALDWDMPFELMCDASDFAIGAVLGQRQEKHFRPIHYGSKTMTEAESNYTTTEKEMLAVVYVFEKFRSYLIMNKSIVYTDQSALKYLFVKKHSKAIFLRWVLLLLEFTFKIKSSEGVYTARKPLIFLRLATMDPPRDIMAQITQPRRKVQLNELHDQAYENSLIYKEKTKRLHDSKIKDRVFNISDRILLFNSSLKIFSGKLKSRWSGPFTISHVFRYGTVELSQPDGLNFKANGHRLDHYFREDIPKMVVLDL